MYVAVVLRAEVARVSNGDPFALTRRVPLYIKGELGHLEVGMSNVLPRNEVRGAPDLAGKYRLIAELGQGGMATVYLAVAIGKSGFRKLAVVKLLRPEIAVDQEFVQMFLDEARLCARLSHPNIVHTYDVGVDEVGHLIAMEYLDGVSMHAAAAKLGRNGGPFKFPLQARVLLDVVEGLRYAHELRDYDGQSLEIVHRDVTPHNIFLTYDGQVKLLDFGIAKAATSSVRTATGVIKGKLTYMAPEQARGDDVDARADLYAVGVMLWEAVTGRRRWPTGLSQPALFTRLASGEPPESPNAALFGYPAEIDGIILRTLAPKPDDRFQTAGELRDALEGVLHKMEPVSLRDLGVMLATAFSEGRQRLRDVIEEQFRAIDSGGHPSEPHQLPAVSPPSFITSSEAFERPSPAAETAKIDSQSMRLAGAAIESTAPPPSSRLRSRTAIAVAAVALGAAALALAVAGSRPRSAPLAEPESASRPAQVAAVASPNPPLTDPAQDARARAETQAASSEVPQAAESTRRFNHAGSLPATPRGATGRAVPSAVASATASTSPASSASAAAESPTNDPLQLRRPENRAKVQLERDNPWP
jgi:eukaryotic-like serine/threonine-protein kinase